MPKDAIALYGVHSFPYLGRPASIVQVASFLRQLGLPVQDGAAGKDRTGEPDGACRWSAVALRGAPRPVLGPHELTSLPPVTVRGPTHGSCGAVDGAGAAVRRRERGTGAVPRRPALVHVSGPIALTWRAMLVQD